jgi:GntR family transcriptional regulator, transcriptional repressor for pyruvate dehydrogenase complex
MDIRPIAPKKIYQSIIEQFVGLLKDEKIKIGEKLPSERELAERFHVSRPSVREALRAMEMIGLIEIKPGDGVFVTEINIAPFMNAISPLLFSTKDFHIELLELRKMLEMRAVELACRNSRDRELRRLQLIVDRMKEALDKNDAAVGAVADIDFHEAIFAITNNMFLRKAVECVLTALESSVVFTRSLMLQEKGNAERLFEQHMQIFQAIRQGDPQKARQRIEEHLDFVVGFYRKRK